MSDEHRIDVEVPGTPEQVWDAIATADGVTAWFAPAEFEGREGAPIRFDLGGGLESTGVITHWEPPRRFVYEEPWDEHGNRLASEWLVEARSGGTCVVRLVSSLFGEGDWSQELDQMREGWQGYLFNLRLYLTHFAGQRCAWIRARGAAQGSLDEAHAALTRGLGLPDARVGERVAASAPGAPPLAGVVERADRGQHHRELVIRADDRVVDLATFAWEEQVYANIHAYVFGPDAAATAAREAPQWDAWMAEGFSSVSNAETAGSH